MEAWPKNLLRQLAAELEKEGKFRILEQKHDQDFAEVDGQSIRLPLTNADGLRVILKKGENGEWQYVCRSHDFEDLRTMINILRKPD